MKLSLMKKGVGTAIVTRALLPLRTATITNPLEGISYNIGEVRICRVACFDACGTSVGTKLVTICRSAPYLKLL